jgi:hypothetical protein
MLSSGLPRGRAGLFTLGRLVLPPSSLELTQLARVRGELATLRPNRRPVLIIGGTQVPRSELACCRVGCDGVLMATRLCRAALRLLSELAARACCQLVRLHGMGNWRPTHRSGIVRASVQRHVAWTALWSETETARVNEQVVVRGGDFVGEAFS